MLLVSTDVADQDSNSMHKFHYEEDQATLVMNY